MTFLCFKNQYIVKSWSNKNNKNKNRTFNNIFMSYKISEKYWECSLIRIILNEYIAMVR